MLGIIALSDVTLYGVKYHHSSPVDTTVVI